MYLEAQNRVLPVLCVLPLLARSRLLHRCVEARNLFVELPEECEICGRELNAVRLEAAQTKRMLSGHGTGKAEMSKMCRDQGTSLQANFEQKSRDLTQAKLKFSLKFVGIGIRDLG
ncbi:hypothetical protein GGX14DRAFT_405515 [Mycena pura]|uniref:Uncharacterized protein n=1 Tax=Mycena pura TaxID=153505 RepID=A0AAD6UVF3_9AGAR|nr:hypothetical protein GGX14DRAFT_405515 [Mycena pura]